MRMKYVGMKQVVKAVKEGKVNMVYIGKDAERCVTDDLQRLCKQKGVNITYVDTMKELGRMAGIEVKAATAAD